MNIHAYDKIDAEERTRKNQSDQSMPRCFGDWKRKFVSYESRRSTLEVKANVDVEAFKIVRCGMN